MPMITIFKKEINLRIQRSIETLFVWEWFKYLFNSAANTRCLQFHNESIVRLRIIIILGARKRLKSWVVLEASSYFARWREWRCGRRSTTIPQQWSSQVGKQTFCKESFWIELISNNLFWFAQRIKRKKAMHLNERLMFFLWFCMFLIIFCLLRLCRYNWMQVF